MGIVNVTPDSFSDGGRFLAPEAAVAHGLSLVAEGADLLDVGGESTRPGATQVSAADEKARVLPVIAALAKQAGVPISVDTSKADVAQAALDAGAAIVNDVSAGRDPRMASVVAKSGCGVVLMHMKGTPADMQDDPTYDDVIDEVIRHLMGAVGRFERAGVAKAQIALDPGIGFGKTSAHNLELLARIRQFVFTGRPICIGVSRKGFLGEIVNRPRDERGPASAAVAMWCLARGMGHVFRVHDVALHRDTLLVAAALTHMAGERGARMPAFLDERFRGAGR